MLTCFYLIERQQHRTNGTVILCFKAIPWSAAPQISALLMYFPTVVSPLRCKLQLISRRDFKISEGLQWLSLGYIWTSQRVWRKHLIGKKNNGIHWLTTVMWMRQRACSTWPLMEYIVQLSATSIIWDEERHPHPPLIHTVQFLFLMNCSIASTRPTS